VSAACPDHQAHLDAPDDTESPAVPVPQECQALQDVLQPSARPPSHHADHAHKARPDLLVHREALEREELRDHLAGRVVREHLASKDPRDHQDSPESLAQLDPQERMETRPHLRLWCPERLAHRANPAHQDQLDHQAHLEPPESPATLDPRDPLDLRDRPERTASLALRDHRDRLAPPERRVSARSTAPSTAESSSRTGHEDSQFNLKLHAA